MAGGKRTGPGKTGSGAPFNGITILLVDDDESVRALAEATLDSHGYMVLKALDSDQALRVSDAHTGSIQLLITDQVMPPFMSGTELAACLRLMRPDIKVLYISGYAATDGVADEIVNLRQHRAHGVGEVVARSAAGEGATCFRHTTASQTPRTPPPVPRRPPA